MNTKLKKLAKLLVIGTCALIAGGCFHPYITAVNLNNQHEPEGMPYYLPKPYIIISKNIRYIPTPTVGLTQTVPIPNTFDNSGQGGGTPKNSSGGTSGASGSNSTSGNGKNGGGKTNNVATVEAATVPSGQNSNPTNTATQGTNGKGNSQNNPGAASPAPMLNTQVVGPASLTVVPSTPLRDGLTPQTFYTYQVIVLPDLTQKYGLRVKGGVGEMRATLNLVNGWMFTGPGPVYFKDSSTADIASANWTGLDNGLESAAKIVSTVYGIPSIGGQATPGGTGKTNLEAAEVPAQPSVISNYAQIWIYEGNLSPDKKSMVWTLLKGSDAPTATLQREYLGVDQTAPAGSGGAGGNAGDQAQPKDTNPDITKQVNQLFKDAGVGGVTALRTSQQVANQQYITTVNQMPTAAEMQKLADGLNTLKVKLSAQQ